MAMIDYGAVVIKNGRQINHDFFEDMVKSVGWSDEDREYFDSKYGEACSTAYLYGNYFAYVGDKDFTIAFYKDFVRLSNDSNNEYIYESLRLGNPGDHPVKSKHVKHFGVDIHIKEITDCVYLASLTYKGDHYNIIYGYGIDPDMETWNDVKVRYLGERDSRRVDHVFRRCLYAEENECTK